MLLRTLSICALATFAVALGGCEVDVEEEGKLPSVDVEGEAGQLPEYEVVKEREGKLPSVDVDVEGGKVPEIDVRGPEVEMGTNEVEVTVPDVDVKMPPNQDSTPKE